MDFAELGRGVATAVDNYRKTTAYGNDWADHFEILIHPDDLHLVRATARGAYFDLDRFLEDRGVLGVPMKEDSEVAPGHPKIRCTWEWVL